MYFPGEARNAADPILNLVEPRRCGTLVLSQSADGSVLLEWNVVFEGVNKTVFFDIGF
jgi:protocatechuate 3,4-dioxygenase, alpha subunit